MARGHNKNRGGRGGSRGSNHPQPRGRGRGAPRGNARGRGRGGPAFVDDFDYPIQQWPSNTPPNVEQFNGFRGRGRGRGVYSIPQTNTSLRGYLSPRGRGRGRGGIGTTEEPQRTYGHGRGLVSKLNAGAPLSKVLYEDRPLLKPITFVRSVYTATLFTQEEDIFQPVVEAAVEWDEKSHIPTADTVSRVFNPPPDDAEQPSDGEEGLEEVDFTDIGRIQAEVDAAASRAKTEVTTPTQESATFFVDTTPGPVAPETRTQHINVDWLQGALGEESEDDEVIVYVAPHPRLYKATSSSEAPASPAQPVPSTSILTGLELGANSSPVFPSAQQTIAAPASRGPGAPGITLELGTLYPEEHNSAQDVEPIDASPDPRHIPPPPSFENVSFSFEKTTVKKQSRRLHPVGTPRSLLKRSRKPRRKSLRGFGAYGAMHEEAQLHEEDPRRDEQRRSDSDDDAGVDELSAGVADMEIDESISLAAMKKFVHSMSAEGSQHVTMDDIADIERMRKEDAEQQSLRAESADEGRGPDGDGGAHDATSNTEEGMSDDGSESGDDEVEAVMHAEEIELIGETDATGLEAPRANEEGARRIDDDGGGLDDDEDDEDDEDSSDEDETPKRGFAARLERLRANTGKSKGKARATYSDDSSDEAMSVQMTWADEDEEYYDSIEAILEEHQDILLSRDRKAKKKLFAAIRDGEFERDIFAGMMTPAKRGKDKDIPSELREQWEKDRAKKAENKRKRALERMQLAADPLAQHKGGKKGRKAMLAAARAADDADLPNRIVDLVSLEQQIRRFLADIGGRDTMALPPADKETRKQIHELAGAFNLKSQSKGSGQTRYTTLIKTTKSGIGINEKKIRSIMKRATRGTWEGPDTGGRNGRSKGMSLARHKEGEEVGKEAPKIGQSNVGFKMLAAMGWSDGDRIGLSGGLEAPLTAIMKKTKLGLGASMQR